MPNNIFIRVKGIRSNVEGDIFVDLDNELSREDMAKGGIELKDGQKVKVISIGMGPWGKESIIIDDVITCYDPVSKKWMGKSRVDKMQDQCLCEENLHPTYQLAKRLEPLIYTNFYDYDEQGRYYLDGLCLTLELNRTKVTLKDGMRVTLWDHDTDEQGNPDPVMAPAIVHYVKDIKDDKTPWRAEAKIDDSFHFSDWLKKRKWVRSNLRSFLKLKKTRSRGCCITEHGIITKRSDASSNPIP